MTDLLAEIIATTTFGLEAVCKREIEKLGFDITDSRNGRITFRGGLPELVRSNLWLRTADRVYVKMGESRAVSFEELFDFASGIPWELWLREDAHFRVTGSSARSVLHSVPACQSIIEKAVVKRLSGVYGTDWFKKNGPVYTIRFMLQNDECVLMIDSSGPGLHDRGYRVKNVPAPIKETMASALVQLSFFKPGRTMADLFCGSGTIPIEAAMLARNMAPGLSRRFDFQFWPQIPEELVREEKKAALKLIDYDSEFRIIARDIDPRAVRIAKENAVAAGVEEDIEFKTADAAAFRPPEERGMIISNPPYGKRIGDDFETKKIYAALKRIIADDPSWSLFLITSDKDFEKQMGRPADRRRKLYNGDIESCYYQYYGEK